MKSMDLFAEEQNIFEEAKAYIKTVDEGAVLDFDKFVLLAKEYGSLLKQIRRATRFSDKTTAGLFELNIDLTGKVNSDALTGIYNRRFMEESLKRNIRSLSRSGGILSVMMIDVDFFKNYNDTYGHSMGDLCLQEIAETLSECITREDDFAARYGGEEFVVVLPYTDERGALVTSERLLETIRRKNIPHKTSSIASRVTVSIGVTTARVQHTDDYSDYIRRADEALYLSKQSGRNKYTFLQFEPPQSTPKT